MISFKTTIERFAQKGEKTGWTYVLIPADVSQTIKPDCKKSYRVSGFLDQLPIQGLAVLPMGEGDFILTLNAVLRKLLNKGEGDQLLLQLEEDSSFEILMPEDLEICLADEQALLSRFLQLSKSHQNYFIKWLETAKTENTRIKRITMIVMAMEQQMDFGQMLRSERAKNQ